METKEFNDYLRVYLGYNKERTERIEKALSEPVEDAKFVEFFENLDEELKQL